MELQEIYFGSYVVVFYGKRVQINKKDFLIF